MRTKAERLLFIINLFRVRKKISLRELANECGVSMRTIYRDLAALSDLNVPIYSDDGYKLEKKIFLPPLNFTDEEMELLGYCIRSSQLMNNRHFRNVLRNIELKILSVTDCCNKDKLNKRLYRAECSDECLDQNHSKAIEKFLEAYLYRSTVSLCLKGNNGRFRELVPFSMNIEKSDGVLTFTKQGNGKRLEFQLDEIEDIECLPTTYDY